MNGLFSNGYLYAILACLFLAAACTQANSQDSETTAVHAAETAAGAVAAAFIPVVGVIGGAIVGGVAAKLRDGGFPNDKLKAMAEAVIKVRRRWRKRLSQAVLSSIHMVESHPNPREEPEHGKSAAALP